MYMDIYFYIHTHIYTEIVCIYILKTLTSHIYKDNTYLYFKNTYLGVADGVAPRAGEDEAAVERLEEPAQLVVGHDLVHWLGFFVW